MNFIQRMLAPHLAQRGVYIFAPMVMTTANKRRGMKHKGGGNTFQHWHRDLDNLWQQHGKRPGTYLTTMLDLFRIHADFPGLQDLSEKSHFRDTVAHLENCLLNHAEEHLGVQPNRFIPYISTHEFETMVFAQLEALVTLFLDKEQAIQALKANVANHDDIEAINSTPEGAPSYRIGNYIPVYEKYKRSDQSGIVNVLEVIGLPVIRESCVHLDAWISQIEKLNETSHAY